MSTSPASTDAARRWRDLYRWVRQTHLWIGAWGALAAVLFGTTGLIMNHRFGDSAWPQGDSQDLEQRTLSIPAEARGSAEAVSLWLRANEGLDADMIRKPRGEGRGEGRGGDAPRGRDARAEGGARTDTGDASVRKSEGPWTLSGGTARESWQVQYRVGEDTAELKRVRHTPLAAFLRLHKGASDAWNWRLLADSFAIGMILLGLSGLWMWARGRSPKQMVLSVFAAGCATFLLVVVPNLL